MSVWILILILIRSFTLLMCWFTLFYMKIHFCFFHSRYGDCIRNFFLGYSLSRFYHIRHNKWYTIKTFKTPKKERERGGGGEEVKEEAGCVENKDDGKFMARSFVTAIIAVILLLLLSSSWTELMLSSSSSSCDNFHIQ